MPSSPAAPIRCPLCGAMNVRIVVSPTAERVIEPHAIHLRAFDVATMTARAPAGFVSCPAGGLAVFE